MSKYTKLASDIIDNIGGESNVQDLKHCVTRLRFTLVDDSLANDDILKNMDGVITIVKAMNQYMVVIGEHVADVYDEVMSQLKLNPTEKKQKPKVKKGFLNWALGMIMAGTSPVLNLLCACGIVKGIAIISTIVGLSADSGIYALLNAAGDSMFFFLPLALGYNVAKECKIDPFVGFLLAAALLYPTIQGVDLNFFGYSVNATYTSSFLPIFFGLIIAVPLYKWLSEILPNVIKGFVVPVIVLLIAFPLTFMILGPLADATGTVIDGALNFFLEKTPILGSILLGGIWQVLVMFGVHAIPSVMAFYNLLAGKPTPLLAVTGNVCFAVCGTLLGVVIKTKDKELKATTSSSLFSSVLGVTEPAMYGIVIPRKILLLTTCIGGAVTGLVVGLFRMKMYSYTGLGAFGLLGMISPDDANFFAIGLMVILPFIASLVTTLFLYNEENEVVNDDENSEKPTKIMKTNDVVSLKMPIDGKISPLSHSIDEAFARGALGKGCMITPENGNVYSPIKGVVRTLFPTKHAIGIVSDDGIEVLIHIGINTVNLEGKYFEANVKQGDAVKEGQLLITFDIKNIEKAGYSTETLIVVTNSEDYLDVIEVDNNQHRHKETIINVIGLGV